MVSPIQVATSRLPHPMRRGSFAAACLLVIVAGCDTLFVPETDDTSGSVGLPAPEPIVNLRLVNLTDVAVDADVYVSTNALNENQASLFVEGNRFTEGVGLAATGLLTPRSTDQIDIPCTAGMVVGTAGGIFEDPETGRRLGTGTRRILEHGLVFDCNGQITFVYESLGATYSVKVLLE